MSFIITRTNGIVTQIWGDNYAAWDFFLGRMSEDIQWFNEGNPYHQPWKFESFDTAVRYMRERERRLSGSIKKKEKDWKYSIRKEL